MGYYVRALPLKKSHPQWKLQFVSYRAEHASLSHAIKPRKECDIPPERWPSLGFRPTMTRLEARARQVQLNAELKLNE